MSANLDPNAELVIDDFIKGKRYGTIELKFDAGRLTLIRQSETIKPSSYRDNRGDEE